MSVAWTLLVEARERGIRLWADDGRLRFQAPAGTMTSEFQTRLTANKQALLDCLAPPKP
ncbi:hypothetical protein JY420_07115, partial [Stenotrophomonas maltophilia]|nr:hypothetical protein [Stenotrophomonas maltophilia]